MIDRRDFALGLGASLALPTAALAVPRRTIKLANTAVVNDAQQVFITVGQHPKLGYYAMEGLDIEYVNMSSIAQAMQALITGEVFVGPAAPGSFLAAYAKDPSIDLIAVYEWLPRNPSVVVVKPDSKIRSVAELAGKRIGIRNQGDPAVMVTKTMLFELGLDDNAVQYIAIGDGAPAGTAIAQDRVDAMVTYDTAAARVELVGFPLRYVPLTPKFANLGSGWNCVKKKSLKEDRKAMIGFFRAKAKSTLFAYANLDQAIDIHWSLYPESKPKSRTVVDAKKEVEFIMKDRKENWMRRPGDPDQRIGAMSLADWQANVQMTAAALNNPKLAAQIGDLGNVFTNELIDEINDFDKAAIIKQAKSFRL